MPKGGRLHPIKHPQRDLWVPNILDAMPKDDIASMEHPMFALVGGDMRVREYVHRGNWVKLTPSAQGLATIKDKDALIYIASQMVEARNRGEKISRTVRFTPYNLLVFTERDTSGWGYRRLLETFHRLRNTSIETTIQSGNYTVEEGFGWIDDWRIVRCGPSGRMESVEITICKWLWHAIMHQNVLTISPDYFRLSRPLERRIYELCRKHPHQVNFRAALAKVRTRFFQLWDPADTQACLDLLVWIARDAEPIRPDRSYPRKTKHVNPLPFAGVQS